MKRRATKTMDAKTRTIAEHPGSGGSNPRLVTKTVLEPRNLDGPRSLTTGLPPGAPSSIPTRQLDSPQQGMKLQQRLTKHTQPKS